MNNYYAIMEINTLRAFFESVENSSIVKEKLLNNIKSCKEKTIVLNLVHLDYNFKDKYINIFYYVEDNEFPEKILSFEEFENILQNKIGKYNYYNALLLYSIFSSERDKGAELKNIIAYSDYINHAIMEYDEFKTGIRYLFQLNLIEEVDKKLFTNRLFKEWYSTTFKDKKRIYALKMIEDIQKYLNKTERNNEINKNIESKITEIDFENSIKEYLK